MELAATITGMESSAGGKREIHIAHCNDRPRHLITIEFEFRFDGGLLIFFGYYIRLIAIIDANILWHIKEVTQTVMFMR